MFWKIYFWILTITLVLYYYAVGFSRIWEIINVVVDAITMIGLFGFCWEKAIIHRLFWRIFLPVCIVWTIVSTFWVPELSKVAEIELPKGVAVFDLIYSLTLVGLGFIGLSLYAYRSCDIWEP